MPFPNIRLADGNHIPAIAFGSGSVNKNRDIHEYIENALDQGFSHLDTAQGYRNEESVGRAIRESGLSRSELFVTSKWSGVTSDIRKSLEESLSNLGLDYVDLYLVHDPKLARGKLESVWRVFEEVREAGLTRSIGVSNFHVEDLEELLKIARIKPVVNQVQFHPYNWADNKPLLEFHTKHGIVTEGYSNLVPITQYPGGPVDVPIARAAERINATPTQVIFSWVRAKGVVIVTTTSKRERLKEYLAVGDLPALTPEEIDSIDKAGSRGPPSTWRLVSSKPRPYHWLLIFILLTFSLYNTFKD